MDEADISQRAEELFLAEALSSRAAPEPLGPIVINGAACCRECEKPIPQARLAAIPGVGLCVDCQAEKEAGA